jgi:hypothetical protein
LAWARPRPLRYKDRIFVTSDHESHQWFFGAFSARTGEELWSVLETKAQEGYGWSTPYVWENRLRTEIVVAGNNGVRSYDPGGKLLWQLKGMSLNTTPTPFAARGQPDYSNRVVAMADRKRRREVNAHGRGSGRSVGRSNAGRCVPRCARAQSARATAAGRHRG